jgi:CheY-like chemotaxis protein
VLIVDADIETRDLLATLLQEIGVTIVEVATGPDALDRIRVSPRPELIFLDLRIADGAGADLVRTIRLDRRSGRTPIVGMLSPGTVPAGSSAVHCDAVIGKPIMPDEAIDAARRLLSGAGV